MKSTNEDELKSYGTVGSSGSCVLVDQTRGRKTCTGCLEGGWSYNHHVTLPSWTTSIAVDGAINAQVTADSVHVTGKVVVAHAGALVSSVYDAAKRANMQLDAHGGCLIWKRCQTVGGVLATNVHHTGLPSYADRCEWVEVIVPEGNTLRADAGTFLFRTTVGGSGRTGIIFRAAFRLSPRTYYKTSPILCSLGLRKSFAEEMKQYVQEHDGVKPMDLMYTRVFQPFGIALNLKSERIEDPSNVTDATDPTLGEPSWTYRLTVSPLFRLSQELPYELFSVFQNLLIAVSALVFTTFAQRGTVHLDHASSIDYLVWQEHQEVEFFVPVSDAEEFGAWWDKYRRKTRYLRNALIGLRYVYGSDLAFAANSPSGQNYVCFNIDCYHLASFRRYTREVENAAKEIRRIFDGRVRSHPGKLNVPSGSYLIDDLCMVAQHDPKGIFEVRGYDHLVFSFRSLPPMAIWVGIVIGIAVWVTS